ncbi:39S ribosomal protein L27, mitochondrial [Rana temporaria]|uniref:39S ribosomal protein L27, mitochondrial n=1 Tax=Rana temporaria TaxID=8407 RepID=UPI001AACC9D7|nr:39S ribosomal protein L27, mitochondrial [Rana temporaria]
MSLLCAVSGRLVSPSPATLILIREASKKAGSSTKNLGGKSPGKRYGVKTLDGNFVHSGNILATQRLMRWHPGSQVGIGRKNTLYALEDGIVRYTKEVYIPRPRSSDTTNVITKLPMGAVLYKTFINVIPKPKEHSFKLVEMM